MYWPSRTTTPSQSEFFFSNAVTVRKLVVPLLICMTKNQSFSECTETNFGFRIFEIRQISENWNILSRCVAPLLRRCFSENVEKTITLNMKTHEHVPPAQVVQIKELDSEHQRFL